MGVMGRRRWEGSVVVEEERKGEEMVCRRVCGGGRVGSYGGGGWKGVGCDGSEGGEKLL